jgi:serine/threonine protein kinase
VPTACPHDVRPRNTGGQVLSFVAPELLMGFAAPVPQCDMWSLGCVLFFLHSDRPLVLQSTCDDVVTHVFNVCGDPAKHWPLAAALPCFDAMSAIGAPLEPTGSYKPSCACSSSCAFSSSAARIWMPAQSLIAMSITIAAQSVCSHNIAH